MKVYGPARNPVRESFLNKIVGVNWNNEKNKPPKPQPIIHAFTCIFSVIVAGYWTSDIEADPDMGLSAMFASTGAEASVSTFRQASGYIYGQSIALVGWSHIRNEFGHVVPFEPEGKFVLTVNVDKNTANCIAVDVVHGGGASGTMAFGDVIVGPMPGLENVVKPLTYNCMGIIGVRPWLAGENSKLIDVRFRAILNQKEIDEWNAKYGGSGIGGGGPPIMVG